MLIQLTKIFEFLTKVVSLELVLVPLAFVLMYAILHLIFSIFRGE